MSKHAPISDVQPIGEDGLPAVHSVGVPPRPAALYALALALTDGRCEKPDALLGDGLVVLRDGGQSAMDEREAVFFLDAGSTFLRAAGLHYPSALLDGAADILEAMAEDVLTGATLPVPGSPDVTS